MKISNNRLKYFFFLRISEFFKKKKCSSDLLSVILVNSPAWELKTDHSSHRDYMKCKCVISAIGFECWLWGTVMFVMFLCSEEIIEYINTTLNPVNTVLQFVIDSSYVLGFQKATLSSLIGAFQILLWPLPFRFSKTWPWDLSGPALFALL